MEERNAPSTQMNFILAGVTIILLGVILAVVLGCLILPAGIFSPNSTQTPQTNASNKSQSASTTEPGPVVEAATNTAPVIKATSTPAATPTPIAAPRGGGDGFACFVLSDYYSGLTCLTKDEWILYKGTTIYIPQKGYQPKAKTMGDSPLGTDTVDSMATCPDGSLLIQTSSKLFRFDGSELTLIVEPERGQYFTGHSLACAEDGKIWMELPGGIGVFDGDTWKTYTYEIIKNGISDLLVTPGGSVWVAAGLNGILKFDGENWKMIPVTKAGPSSDSKYLFYDLAIDHKGRIWAGAYLGLAVLEGDKLVPVDTGNEEGFMSIAIDSQDRVWAATEHSGILVYKDGARQIYEPKKGELSSGSIHSLSVDANDRVWIGTAWGLAVLDGGQWATLFMSNSELNDNAIKSIAVSGPGPNLPDLQEKETSSIAGRIVQPGGVPLANADIEVCVEGLPYMYYIGKTPCTGQPYIARGRTDSDGKFKITDLPTGYYFLTFDKGDRWVKLGGVTIASSERLLVKPGETLDVGEITYK